MYQRIVEGQIASIRSVGRRRVWDLAVETDASYVAHGFINHNSNDPNLQNIPVKSKLGKRIRQMFIGGRWGDCSPDICLPHLRDVPVPDLDPDFPMRLIVADFKQLEMCILAHFSRDENMIGAIRDKQDLHCKTVMLASALGAAGLPFGITYEEAVAAKKAADKEGYTLTDFEALLVAARGQLKSTGFGIVYGIGALKLGMQLGLEIVTRRGRDTCPEAQDLINRYLYEIFPGVGQFIADTRQLCAEELKVFTLLGHPRRLPDILSTDRQLRAQAERQGPNAEIQGCKDADSFVLTDGGAVTLRELHENRSSIGCYSGTAPAYRVYKTGTKEVFRLETTYGVEYVTKDHRFFVYEDEDLAVRRLEELCPGDFVVARSMDCSGSVRGLPAEATPALAELIGVLCGDGSYTRERDFQICFGNDMDWAFQLKDLLNECLGDDHHSALRRSKGSNGESWIIDVSAKGPRQLLMRLGLAPASEEDKTLPRWLFTAPREFRVACLRGMFDSDGGLLSGKYPSFTNIAPALAYGFMTLAHSLGFGCRVARYDYEGGKPYLRAIIVPEQAREFVDLVQPRVRHKNEVKPFTPRIALPPALIRASADAILASRAWSTMVEDRRVIRNPGQGTWKERSHSYMAKANFAKEEQAHLYRMLDGSGTAASCSKFLRRVNNRTIEDHAVLDRVANLRDLVENTSWAKFLRIDSVGMRETMDIEVFGDDHTYIGQGLLQHNSAADICNEVMEKCEADEELRRLGVRMLLQVHDELLFEVPDIDEVATAGKERIKTLMENPFEMRVPILVDIHDGPNWGAAKG